MKVQLIEIETKKTVTNCAYYKLTFFNPTTGCDSYYWIWQFIHNKENQLEHVWEMVDNLKINHLYDMKFRKAIIGGRIQHVITNLTDATAPLTYLR